MHTAPPQLLSTGWLPAVAKRQWGGRMVLPSGAEGIRRLLRLAAGCVHVSRRWHICQATPPRLRSAGGPLAAVLGAVLYVFMHWPLLGGDWGCPTPRPACRPACGRDFRGPCCMRCLRGCVLAGSAAVAGREAVVMTGGTLLPVVSGVLSWCWGARGGSACLAHPVGVRALSGSRTSAYGTPRDVCACR